MKSPPPSPLTWEQTCDDDIFLKFKCMELMNVYEKIIVCENVTCLLMCYEGLMSKECFVGLGKIPLKTHVYFMSILKAAPNTTPLKYWCSILKGLHSMWHSQTHVGVEEGYYSCLGATNYILGAAILHFSFINISSISFIFF